MKVMWLMLTRLVVDVVCSWIFKLFDLGVVLVDCYVCVLVFYYLCEFGELVCSGVG